MIYPTRPQQCVTYECLWKCRPEIPEWMYPLKTKVVMNFSDDHKEVVCLTDRPPSDKVVRYLRELGKNLPVTIFPVGAAPEAVERTD